MDEQDLNILKWALSMSGKYWDSFTDHGYFYDWDRDDYWKMTHKLAEKLGVEENRIYEY